MLYLIRLQRDTLQGVRPILVNPFEISSLVVNESSSLVTVYMKNGNTHTVTDSIESILDKIEAVNARIESTEYNKKHS